MKDEVPTTRAEAKRIGATHYFTGLPCKHGHIALRKTKGACVECIKVEWQQSAAGRAEYFSAYNKSAAGLASKQRYYAANKELVIAKANLTDIELRRQYKRTWKKTHPEQDAVNAKMYSRRVRTAMPKWLSREDREQIKNMYRMAMQMTKTTGELYTVDHIIPIRSDVVCGLHTPWNLRIIPHVDNSSKGNRFEV
jgi:hypothetical protein